MGSRGWWSRAHARHLVRAVAVLCVLARRLGPDLALSAEVAALHGHALLPAFWDAVEAEETAAGTSDRTTDGMTAAAGAPAAGYGACRRCSSSTVG